MSLVHEALQKAEREKQRKAGGIPAPIISPLVHAAPGANVRPAASIVAPVVEVRQQKSHLLTALITCVAVVAMVAIVSLVSNVSFTFRESRKAVAAKPETLSGTEALPATVVASPRLPLLPGATEHVATQKPVVPTAAPAETSATVAETRFRITGITTDPEGTRWAIINGQLRSEGQYVDGATLKTIERDRVTLEVDGHSVVVRLF
jgi:type II secretory pathway component PulC